MLDGFVVPTPLIVLACIVILALLGRWISRDPVRGVYLAFLASGILLTPNLPVVRDKLTATEVIFLLTWIALLLRRSRHVVSVPLLRGQILSIQVAGIFIFWTILSFALNAFNDVDDLTPSIVETVNFLYGYLMFVTTVLLTRDWRHLEQCLYWWVAGVAVVVFFGVWAMTGGAPSWTYEEFTRRVSSTLRNENQVPSFLLPVLAVLVFMAVRKGGSRRYQVGMWALVGGTLLTAVGTGSRTALLMIILSILGIAYAAMRTAIRRPYRLMSMVNMGIALLVALFGYIAAALVAYEGDYALGRTPPWQRPVVMFYDWMEGETELDTTRPAQISAVMEHIDEHVLIGTGPKSYGSMYGMAEVHNTYAGVLLQTGSVGLILFVWWLLHLLWHSLRQVRRIHDPWQKVMFLSLIVGMSTLLLYNMTIFGLRQRTIWLLAGLMVAAWSLASRRPAMSGAGVISPGFVPTRDPPLPHRSPELGQTRPRA